MQALYGLAKIGFGRVEDTFTSVDTGKEAVPVVLTFVAAGIMANAVMHGIEDIGRDNS